MYNDEEWSRIPQKSDTRTNSWEEGECNFALSTHGHAIAELLILKSQF